MDELASKWGPAPRTLLQNFGDDQELLLEPTMRSTASETIPNCSSILHSIGNLDAPPIDSGPSSIFFIRPKKFHGTVSRVLHTIYIPTQKIAEILGEAVCRAAEKHRQNFFDAMIALPATRGAAGFIFEIWIHSFLASGNPVQCTWHDKENLIKILAKRSLPSTLRLANQRTVSTSSELQHATPPFYWRAPPDFPGIDRALFDEDDTVYAIQITISSSHKSPDSGLERLRHLLGKEKAKKCDFRVLFIGNDLEQSKVVSKEYFDKKHDSDSLLKRKKPKSVPVGWCATSPVNAEIAVVASFLLVSLPLYCN